ncbi:hypothetical protein [Lysobacter sp. HA35]
MTTETCVRVASLLVGVMLLASCSPHASSDAATPAASPATANAKTSAVTHAAWTLPVDAAQQPDIAAAPDGSLLLSWIEQASDTQRLRFARWRDGAWTAPQQIAAGEGIGNAADMPHVRQTSDGALWATWLRRTGGGEARDVVLARSTDGGRTWSAPAAVNTDGTSTEHGFAAFWPEGRDALGVAWLDGRAKAGAPHQVAGMPHDMHAGQGAATMLRTATFDATLARRDERALDTSTCDCCQVDVVDVNDSPRLVYRARREGEIRDIAILRRDAGTWTAPKPVHDDHWSVDACPINGPAITARGNTLAVAWYTMPASTPMVRFATSNDGGATFGPARDLATGTNVLGRIDAASDANGTWVSWLEEQGDAQRLRVARIPADASAPVISDIANVAGRGRGTGWPRLLASGDRTYLVWTEAVDGHPHLHGATLAAH